MPGFYIHKDTGSESSAPDKQNASLSLFRAGEDIGTLLAHDDAQEAKDHYDALILRIQDDQTKPNQADSDGLTKDRQKEQVLHGIAANDHDDVALPGYVVDWKTENVVNSAIDQLGNYCKSHYDCPGYYFMQIDPSKALPGSPDKLSDELDKMNKWLSVTAVPVEPDPFLQWTFMLDFNRRVPNFGVNAVFNDFDIVDLEAPNKNSTIR